MYTYHTKTFYKYEEIDTWLNSFRDESKSHTINNHDIVGYVPTGNGGIVITIKLFKGEDIEATYCGIPISQLTDKQRVDWLENKNYDKKEIS